MILWHLGTAAALVYVTLGRRRIDYRFILAGAIAPDVLDPLLHLVFDFEPDSPGRWIAHSLLAVIAVLAFVVIAFRGERRLAVFGLGVGWLMHLVSDGMWEAPRTFFWPLFGSRFQGLPAEPYSWDLLTTPFDHLTTWGAELVGLGILAWFWVAFRLGEDRRLSLFLSDGYLRP